MLIRSLLIQATWNYRTLIGTGFAFCLLPALRHLYGNDPAGLAAATSRHKALFNSHPYLATLAAGAVAKLEREGTAPETVDRFKGALRGPLGSLGDRLFWLGWRPLCALLGLSMILLGAPWWAAVGMFLIAYNVVHLYVRAWGLRVGLEAGMGVAAVLRESALERGAQAAARAGAFVAGGTLVLGAVAAGATGPAWTAGLAALAGFAVGARIRIAAWVFVTLVWVGCLGGWLSFFAE